MNFPFKHGFSKYHRRCFTGRIAAASREGLLLERWRAAPLRASFDLGGERLLSSLTEPDRSGAIRLCADFYAI